jgi:hypothetical protein
MPRSSEARLLFPFPTAQCLDDCAPFQVPLFLFPRAVRRLVRTGRPPGGRGSATGASPMPRSRAGDRFVGEDSGPSTSFRAPGHYREIDRLQASIASREKLFAGRRAAEYLLGKNPQASMSSGRSRRGGCDTQDVQNGREILAEFPRHHLSSRSGWSPQDSTSMKVCVPPRR